MRFSAVFWVGSIAIAAIGSAQQPAPPASQAGKPAPPASGLKLLILQGRDTINSIQGGAPASPVVEVRDENDQPVEGAQVIFSLPVNGPGGSFLDSKITFTTRTNVQGQASAPYTPNRLPGRFSIQVTATSGERYGQVLIPQSNEIAEVRKQKRSWFHPSRKNLIILGAIGAGAIVTVVLATRSSPTVVISAGPPVFGGPH